MKPLPEDIPKELWGLVFERLDNILDRLHFSYVCSIFQSVAEENNPCRLSRVLLLLPPYQNSETRQFFSLADARLYQVHVPELQGKWCCGSSFGWLFAVDFHHSGDINLLNPFTRTQILLPHISTFTNPPKPPDFHQDRNEIWYIRKAILSTSPAGTARADCFVMAIFSNLWALAFCRLGDHKWTTLTSKCGPCEDVIYYRDKFYAITNWGALIAWDLQDSKAPKLTVLIEPTHELPYLRYLVESPNGELVKISKVEDENGCIVGFKVCKLVDDEGKQEWMEVNRLGDDAVFLGYNRAICVSVKENPGWCSANCIYFTEDNAEKYYYEEGCKCECKCNDVGVYKIDDGSLQHSYHCLSPSIWITPSFRKVKP